MIQPTRIKHLNDNPVKSGDYVLYWMQQSQRTEFNHALEYAIFLADELGQPLVVLFGITEKFPDANARHYYFMLEGLTEVETNLKQRGIQFVVRRESPEIAAEELSERASMLITDCGYLKFQRNWRTHVAETANCPVIQVETDVIVPVEVASPKAEYTAGTFRPKISKKLDDYLMLLGENQFKIKSLDLEFDSLDISDTDAVIAQLDIDKSVSQLDWITGGTSHAKKLLSEFIENKLDKFHELRNDPSENYLSDMSPYLHFGQISPLYIALKIMETDSPGKDAYLEELIVRRELSMNLCFYDPDYDSLNCLPDWAQQTLIEHKDDHRKYIYTLEQFETAQTHDPYWNAAQKEMMYRGKMHGYMRMYWGKKILEWSETPEKAHEIALYLNNKYSLDGRDPNGFTGVAWCFGKHDRAWKEREIYGKVRYMNDRGLERKFDIEEYVKKVEKYG